HSSLGFSGFCCTTDMARRAVFALALCLSGVTVCSVRPSLSASVSPQPCAAPLQWEGRTVQYDHSTGRNTRAVVSYDAQNQRVRVLEEKRKHTPCKRYFEYIYLFTSAVLFQIEQVTKNCAKLNLTEQWDPYDIPMNSTFEDQYYIGGPGDMIEVQEWSDRKPARKHETWVGVYTLNDCYPVQETYTKNSSVTTSTRFFDLELGISDPGVFTPPSTCLSAIPEQIPYGSHYFGLIWEHPLEGDRNDGQVNGGIQEQLKKEVLEYDYHKSFFDIFVLAVFRFTVLILAYAVCRLRHWWAIAITTAVTSAFLIAKVIISKLLSQGAFGYLLPIISFILAWIETWFLDFKVLPQEANDENRYLTIQNIAERAPLMHPGPVSDGQFYSPPESVAGVSGHETAELLNSVIKASASFFPALGTLCGSLSEVIWTVSLSLIRHHHFCTTTVGAAPALQAIGAINRKIAITS
ncbi:hypothetical protein NFI96_017477, partial [Prochilodus magdalenae]